MAGAAGHRRAATAKTPYAVSRKPHDPSPRHPENRDRSTDDAGSSSRAADGRYPIRSTVLAGSKTCSWVTPLPRTARVLAGHLRAVRPGPQRLPTDQGRLQAARRRSEQAALGRGAVPSAVRRVRHRDERRPRVHRRRRRVRARHHVPPVPSGAVGSRRCRPARRDSWLSRDHGCFRQLPG